MGKKIAVSGIAVLIIIMIGVSIVFFLTDDREGPGIEYTDKEITYHEGDDTKELLKDVTAVDAKDGDVSSSLIIENIIILSDNQKAKIIYAAKDSKNNITTVSYTHLSQKNWQTWIFIWTGLRCWCFSTAWKPM